MWLTGGLLSNEGNTLKDTAMLKRLNDISALPDKNREYILYTIDELIKSAKLQALKKQKPPFQCGGFAKYFLKLFTFRFNF